MSEESQILAPEVEEILQDQPPATTIKWGLKRLLVLPLKLVVGLVVMILGMVVFGGIYALVGMWRVIALVKWIIITDNEQLKKGLATLKKIDKDLFK